MRFPTGPGLALLPQPDADWPQLEEAEKAPELQLRGYTLDKKQRPTFRYVIGDLEVADAFLDEADGPALVRTLTFSQPPPDALFIRLAADQQLEAAAPSQDRYRLAHGLVITVPDTAFLREKHDLVELLVPLGGCESLTIDYRFQAP